MQNWHALRVMANCEKGIAHELGKLRVNCETYYPQKTIWSRVHGARRKKLGASREKKEIALIKGYLFVKADLEEIGTEFWRRLRNVFGWVAVNGRPLVVNHGQIEKLIEAESIGDYDETRRILQDLRSMLGKVFYLNDGLLQGNTVRVFQADEAFISVSVEGSGLKAKLPLDFFQKNAQRQELDDRG